MIYVERYLCYNDDIDNVYFYRLSDATKFCKEYDCACIDITTSRLLFDYRVKGNEE